MTACLLDLVKTYLYVWFLFDTKKNLCIDLFDQKPFGSKMSVIATGTGIFTVLGVVVKKGFWKKRKAFFANGRDVSGVKKCEKK